MRASDQEQSLFRLQQARCPVHLRTGEEVARLPDLPGICRSRELRASDPFAEDQEVEESRAGEGSRNFPLFFSAHNPVFLTIE